MIDTEHRDNIVCPHCGYESRDTLEVEFGASECAEYECPRCLADLVVVRHVTVTYSSRTA